MVGTTNLTVEEDTDLVLDARDGRRLTAPTVAGHDVEVESAALLYTSKSEGELWRSYTEGIGIPPSELVSGRVFYTPVDRSGTGVFEASVRWQLDARPAGRSGKDRREALDLLTATRELSPALSPRLSRRDLGKLAPVRYDVHRVARNGVHEVHSLAWTTTSEVATAQYSQTRPPYVRRVLTNADPGQRRSHCLVLSANFWAAACGDSPGLRAGRASEVEIGGAVHGAPNASWRHPGSFYYDGGLSDGRHRGPIAVPVGDAHVRLLTKAGHQLGSAKSNLGVFEIPQRRLALRLIHDQDTTEGPFNTATRTRTVWDFTSEMPDPSRELATSPPLLDVEYGADLTGSGRARKHGPMVLQLGFDRAVLGAARLKRITGVKVWWSADRGRHWRGLAAHRRGDTRFNAVLDDRGWRRGPDLSLRVVARDQDGNRIDQRAIGLIRTP